MSFRNAAQVAAESDLIRLASRASACGWVVATSGNFSVRLEPQTILVTRSGRDKGALTREDLATVDLNAPLPLGISAEAPIHTAIYRALPEVNALAHVHTLAATVLSRRYEARGELVIERLEMQKAIRGQTTHEAAIALKIYKNSQEMVTLAERVRNDLPELRTSWGFLLSGHGIYVWGTSAEEAWRHAEAIDFLLRVRMQEEAYTP